MTDLVPFRVVFPGRIWLEMDPSDKARVCALPVAMRGLVSVGPDWDDIITIKGTASRSVVTVFMAVAQGHPLGEVLDRAEAGR